MFEKYRNKSYSGRKWGGENDDKQKGAERRNLTYRTLRVALTCGQQPGGGVCPALQPAVVGHGWSYSMRGDNLSKETVSRQTSKHRARKQIPKRTDQ